MNSSSIRQFWRRLSGSVHPDDEPIFTSHPMHSFNLRFPPPAFIGDVDSAPIVLLMSNGGYKPGITEAEFPDDPAAVAFRNWLHGGAPMPSLLGSYYTDQAFGHWIESGSAVIVNAVPYRSCKLSKERYNRKVAAELPSLAVHRRWLMSELLPAATAGDRFILVHRNGWWSVPQDSAGPSIVFSDRPAEQNRPTPDRDRLERAREWLRERARIAQRRQRDDDSAVDGVVAAAPEQMVG